MISEGTKRKLEQITQDPQLNFVTRSTAAAEVLQNSPQDCASLYQQIRARMEEEMQRPYNGVTSSPSGNYRSLIVDETSPAVVKHSRKTTRMRQPPPWEDIVNEFKVFAFLDELGVPVPSYLVGLTHVSLRDDLQITEQESIAYYELYQHDYFHFPALHAYDFVAASQFLPHLCKGGKVTEIIEHPLWTGERSHNQFSQEAIDFMENVEEILLKKDISLKPNKKTIPINEYNIYASMIFACEDNEKTLRRFVFGDVQFFIEIVRYQLRCKGDIPSLPIPHVKISAAAEKMLEEQK